MHEANVTSLCFTQLSDTNLFICRGISGYQMEVSTASVKTSAHSLCTSEQPTNITTILGENAAPWLTVGIYLNLILYTFSVLGNSILMYAIIKNVNMRTATNLLVFSHLSAEFAASNLGIVAHIWVLVVDEKPSVLSPWCVTGRAMVEICMGGGLLSLLCIAVDRYLALIKIHHKVTMRQVQIVLAIIWSLCIAYGIPWDIIFFGKRFKLHCITWVFLSCHTDTTDNSSIPTESEHLQYGLISIGVILPLMTITFIGFRILRMALKVRRRVGIAGMSVNHITAAYLRSAVTTLLIISVYLVCLLPTIAFAVKCMDGQWSDRSLWLFSLAKATLCFRSACFPVIYVARNHNLSTHIRRFLYSRIGISGKMLCLRQARRRISTKVHVYGQHCSSFRLNNGYREATHGTSQTSNPQLMSEVHALGVTRKLAFADLETIDTNNQGLIHVN